jgi:hypothetical protein
MNDSVANLFYEAPERVIRKPIVYEWEWGEPAKHCGFCKVRINAIPDKYGTVICPNNHANQAPRP